MESASNPLNRMQFVLPEGTTLEFEALACERLFAVYTGPAFTMVVITVNGKREHIVRSDDMEKNNAIRKMSHPYRPFPR